MRHENQVEARNGPERRPMQAGPKTQATRAGQCKWPPLPFKVLLLLASFGMQSADSLRFTSIQMPALVQRGTNFWLACQYELQQQQQVAESKDFADGLEQLYSVKWYKNNEEFYRVIFGQASAGQQQQYFTQPGVNVLMSSSNATHVRLLNASLESEGAFACEISTQNLSTIRFEKEIKVYVLPASGLSLSGLRSSYAFGDQVELQCSSDFSRPAGALAWFINGRRVGITPNNQIRQVSASTSNEPSTSEPKLSRTRLALKFKLTSELVAAEFAANYHLRLIPDGNNINLQRNQSKSPSSGLPDLSNLTASAQSGIQTGRLLELLRLECRYKLTEVSDVTFAELRVATQTGSGTPASDHRGERRRRPARSSWPSRRRFSAPQAEPEAERAERARKTGLSKTLANQIQQSRCLAERDDLLELMAGSGQTSSACGLGLLAIQRDDPVLLAESAELDGAGGDTLETGAGQEGRAQFEDRLELALGSIVGVNCSTLGALASGRPERRRHAAALGQWPASNEPIASRPPANYCADWEARRRLLISGKYQSDTGDTRANQRRRKQPPGAGSSRLRDAHNNNNNNNNNNPHHHIAYVSVDDNASGRPARRFTAPGDNKLSLPAESSNAVPKSLDQLHDIATRGHYMQVAAQLHAPSSWLAPPLLEWFINNQEAPKSSARYSPELPLVSVASNRSRRKQRRQMAPSPEDEDENQVEGAPLELPSIDYREYFANFESRPIDQFLMLRLALDKKHFMTPDSLLRLRCTSTQAQVLAADSLDVSLFLLPTGTNPLDLIQEQRKQDNQRGSPPSRWLQRQHPTIKSKHIHRQSLASQSPSGQQQANSAAALKSNPIPSLWTSGQLLALAWWLLAMVPANWLRH